MNKVAVKNKIISLEAEIRLLKKTVVEQPDLDIDEKNWKKLKPTVKKIRSRLFRKNYG